MSYAHTRPQMQSCSDTCPTVPTDSRTQSIAVPKSNNDAACTSGYDTSETGSVAEHACGCCLPGTLGATSENIVMTNTCNSDKYLAAGSTCTISCDTGYAVQHVHDNLFASFYFKWFCFAFCACKLSCCNNAAGMSPVDRTRTAAQVE